MHGRSTESVEPATGHNADYEFVAELQLLMKLGLAEKDEIICRIGEMAQELFVLKAGEVQIFHPPSALAGQRLCDRAARGGQWLRAAGAKRVSALQGKRHVGAPPRPPPPAILLPSLLVLARAPSDLWSALAGYEFDLGARIAHGHARSTPVAMHEQCDAAAGRYSKNKCTACEDDQGRPVRKKRPPPRCAALRCTRAAGPGAAGWAGTLALGCSWLPGE